MTNSDDSHPIHYKFSPQPNCVFLTSLIDQTKAMHLQQGRPLLIVLLLLAATRMCLASETSPGSSSPDLIRRGNPIKSYSDEEEGGKSKLKRKRGGRHRLPSNLANIDTSSTRDVGESTTLSAPMEFPIRNSASSSHTDAMSAIRERHRSYPSLADIATRAAATSPSQSAREGAALDMMFEMDPFVSSMNEMLATDPSNGDAILRILSNGLERIRIVNVNHYNPLFALNGFQGASSYPQLQQLNNHYQPYSRRSSDGSTSSSGSSRRRRWSAGSSTQTSPTDYSSSSLPSNETGLSSSLTHRGRLVLASDLNNGSSTVSSSSTRSGRRGVQRSTSRTSRRRPGF